MSLALRSVDELMLAILDNEAEYARATEELLQHVRRRPEAVKDLPALEAKLKRKIVKA